MTFQRRNGNGDMSSPKRLVFISLQFILKCFLSSMQKQLKHTICIRLQNNNLHYTENGLSSFKHHVKGALATTTTTATRTSKN